MKICLNTLQLLNCVSLSIGALGGNAAIIVYYLIISIMDDKKIHYILYIDCVPILLIVECIAITVLQAYLVNIISLLLVLTSNDNQ